MVVAVVVMTGDGGGAVVVDSNLGQVASLASLVVCLEHLRLDKCTLFANSLANFANRCTHTARLEDEAIAWSGNFSWSPTSTMQCQEFSHAVLHSCEFRYLRCCRARNLA